MNKSEFIRAYADKLGVTIKEATCTEDGSILYHCTQPDCEKEKTSAIPALGHDYDMDTCLRCGEEDPSFQDPEIDDGGIADTPPFTPPIEPDLE